MRLNTKSQIKSGWDCWCVANCDFFGSLNEAATWFRSGICLFAVPIPQIEFVGNERAKTDKKKACIAYKNDPFVFKCASFQS